MFSFIALVQSQFIVDVNSALITFPVVNFNDVVWLLLYHLDDPEQQQQQQEQHGEEEEESEELEGAGGTQQSSDVHRQ